MAKNRYSGAAKKAAVMTDKELTTELALIGKLSRDQIKALLPGKKDKQIFAQLMEVVENDTAMDKKISYLQNNIQGAGKVAFTLLKALV